MLLSFFLSFPSYFTIIPYEKQSNEIIVIKHRDAVIPNHLISKEIYFIAVAADDLYQIICFQIDCGGVVVGMNADQFLLLIK